MKLTLHLIRHGETNWNAERRAQGQSDSILTERGRQQAEDLRPFIDELNIAAVYTSSNLRTQQTTEILAANLPHLTENVDGLREICLGPWEAQLWEDLGQQFPEQVGHFRDQPERFDIAGAETFAQLRDRGMNALETIIETELELAQNAESSRHVLVVSHGAILKAALCGYGEVDLSRVWQPTLDNCSHSILTADASGARAVEQIGGVSVRDLGWSS